jgi:methionyl-tRNA formyltransferase
MLKQIVLLTAQRDQQLAITQLMQAHNPSLSFRYVLTKNDLEDIDPATLTNARLIAFTSGTIVPQHILSAVGHGAYNFHPGPPTYAGWAPAHFALYENARNFGATAHEMVARVDAGPIIGIESFTIPQDINIRELEQIAFVRLAFLFWRMSKELATYPEPLPTLPIRWSGTKSTRQMYIEMCHLPSDISKEEMARRIRAFSDDFRGIYPTITVHGFEFRCAQTAATDQKQTSEASYSDLKIITKAPALALSA